MCDFLALFQAAHPKPPPPPSPKAPEQQRELLFVSQFSADPLVPYERRMESRYNARPTPQRVEYNVHE